MTYERLYGSTGKLVGTITLKERQKLAQKYYHDILEDYSLAVSIPYDYKWEGIVNSYVRKHKLRDVFDAMNTAEYYLHGDKAFYDSGETVKNYTNKIGGILHNRSLGK
tara:strand:- start:1426 stop:1749 length:324 start_codon:yes stop_codon:yes gene_type:complete